MTVQCTHCALDFRSGMENLSMEKKRLKSLNIWFQNYIFTWCTYFCYKTTTKVTQKKNTMDAIKWRKGPTMTKSWRTHFYPASRTLTSLWCTSADSNLCSVMDIWLLITKIHHHAFCSLISVHWNHFQVVFVTVFLLVFVIAKVVFVFEIKSLLVRITSKFEGNFAEREIASKFSGAIYFYHLS